MIRIENLSKHFNEVRAVDGINFTADDGEILGFLGPNGAGKSTTLKIITTYLMPTSGRVTIDDKDVTEHSAHVRARIGYLPELNPLYSEMCVYDQLRFAAQVRGITGRDFTHAVKRVINTCGIRTVMHRDIGQLSKGYRQRVGLAMAIIHDPDILIMDEPVSGLDPNQIVEIRDLIKSLGKEKTVIISSHILQEVQAMADRMVILNDGKVVADGTTQELMASFEGKAQLSLEIKNATDESLKGFTAKFPQIKLTSQSESGDAINLQLEYPAGHDIREQVFNYAVESGWVLLKMARNEARLEDVFRSLTGKGGSANA